MDEDCQSVDEFADPKKFHKVLHNHHISAFHLAESNKH